MAYIQHVTCVVLMVILPLLAQEGYLIGYLHVGVQERTAVASIWGPKNRG